MIKYSISFSLFLGLAVALVTPDISFAQSYTAIGARKPKNLKAKQIVFVACSSAGVLGKYRGPRLDKGAAVFKATLTATAAKKLIKPITVKKTKRLASNQSTERFLVNGKIIFSTKKNLSTLNAQIDACGATSTPTPTPSPTPTPATSATPTPGPTQVAVAVGSWQDTLRSTSGQMNLTVTVDSGQRKMTLKLGVTGQPLGIINAANIPPETYEVSIPAGQNSAPFTFDSSFMPGNIAGTATIDTQAGTFSATGTATHNSSAGSFANTTATFTASGPITGNNVGAITVNGVFPVGNNNFVISTNPAQ